MHFPNLTSHGVEAIRLRWNAPSLYVSSAARKPIHLTEKSPLVRRARFLSISGTRFNSP